MDLLSQRYASPCFFLNGMIQTGRLDEFVDNLIETHNAEKDEKALWEFYLHKAPFYEGSFNDFVAEMKTTKEHQNMSDQDIETAVQHTQNILSRFNPEEKGGE